MEGLLANIFGGAAPAPAANPPPVDDFADFVSSSIPQASATAQSFLSQFLMPSSGPSSNSSLPFTRWYRVWERHSVGEFTQEYFIFAIVLVVALIHIYGSSSNRDKAKAWIASVSPILDKEFTLVGFGAKPPSAASVQAEGLGHALEGALDANELSKEMSVGEYKTYASGRQNIVALDMTLKLHKRNNPIQTWGEMIVGSIFESMGSPEETVNTTIYPFDGRESEMMLALADGKDAEETARRMKSNSAFDGFVWALVHKDQMKRLRDERYDISLTVTRDSEKIPPHLVTMSEAAELNDLLLKPDLVKLVADLGDRFRYLLISDLPVDKPAKIDELRSRKRLFLSIRPAGSTSEQTASNALLTYFIRLTDSLVSSSRLRPETARKIKAVRDREAEKLKRVDEDEREAERAKTREKDKRAQREKELRGLSAEDQRKYLEREREKERKKAEKKMSRKA